MTEIKEYTIVKFLSKALGVRTILLLGSLLFMLSFILGWLDQPIRGWLKGYEIPLSDTIPHVVSYGLLCFIGGLLSLLALSERFRYISFVTGAVGLFLSLHFLLSCTLFNSQRIHVINDLNQQEHQILLFNQYLPPNKGTEPTFDPALVVETIQDRLYATLHFASFGWYAALFGSLLLLFVFFMSQGQMIKKRWLLLSIACLVSYVALSFSYFGTAEYYRNRGDYYLATGMYSKAVDAYDKAQRLDGNFDYMKSFHTNLGKAYFLLGRSDKADYYIYQGTTALQEADFSMAIFSFSVSVFIEPSIAKSVGNNFTSWAYIDYGFSEYKKGIVSSAIGLWSKSLEIDPAQIQAYYFLSRAYYDISAYEESILAGKQFLKASKEKIMRSNICSNIADAYYKMHQYELAREYYLRSLSLDKDRNLRAILSLIGK
jgi:tetratricopeptide (TPR) repeat protein